MLNVSTTHTRFLPPHARAPSAPPYREVLCVGVRGLVCRLIRGAGKSRECTRIIRAGDLPGVAPITVSRAATLLEGDLLSLFLDLWVSAHRFRGTGVPRVWPAAGAW